MSVPGTGIAGLIFEAGWTAYRYANQPQDFPQVVTNKPWHPPQWDSRPQLVSITVNEPVQTEQVSTKLSDVNASSQQFQGASSGDTFAQSVSQAKVTTVPTQYFFDAVFRITHVRRYQVTKHPVQSGASTTDHIYRHPVVVTLEIGMSDAMDRVVASLYTGNKSKSVAAYQEFCRIADLRIPIQLTTRLKTYSNMAISDITAPEDRRTKHALRAFITFEEIMFGTVATTTVPPSARPQQTDENKQGTKQPANVPPIVTQKNKDPLAVTPAGELPDPANFKDPTFLEKGTELFDLGVNATSDKLKAFYDSVSESAGNWWSNAANFFGFGKGI